MSKNKNFIELQAEDNLKLEQVLKTHPKFESISVSENRIHFYSTDPLKTSEINQFLSENHVFVSHLQLRKNSLEEQFLELTGN
jgi:ABC-2 type transport system ATP-binding protein